MTLRRALICCLVLITSLPAFNASADEGCGPDRNETSCGSVTADQAAGDFHGLIAVKGQPGVLSTAAHSGTKPGCADCVWTLVMLCVGNTPTDPHEQQPCTGAANSRQCRNGQTAFRLYLSTAATTNELVDTLCLGGVDDVIPVGDIAAADVARYLRDVVPPDLVLRTQPPGHALAGLPTYFMVRPPDALRPATLNSGTPGVVETITIAPLSYAWSWGDGSDAFSTDDPGAPYPDGRVTHTYATGGRMHGGVTTQWGATYTVTVDGQTFGPYDATGGQVPHVQTFTLPVATAHSHLVSH